MFHPTDTIAAIATPPGQGGIGIIRLSGPKAFAIALCLSGKKNFIARQATYTPLKDQDDSLIDEGLVLFFPQPHSFTGEDIIELQLHGSPIVLDYVLRRCLELGARLAEPGEFSERAFLNDKIDLTQAEAIADLIHAHSLTAARMAVRSLQGDFSAKINELNEEVIALRMYVEAAIDFPEEEIDFLADGKISAQLTTILQRLESIISNASQGNMLSEGLAIVIAGRPNVGKSTLINCLAKRDVAIVTDVAGTTRDVIREHILLDDIPVHVIDTAGLHASNDIVEQEGMKRTWQEIERADCVLLINDVNQVDNTDLADDIKAKLNPHIPIITVFNKIDTQSIKAKEDLAAIFLSAKTGEGINYLKDKIKKSVGFRPPEGAFLARRRHLQALHQAKESLLQGQEQLSTQKAGELLAEDLRLAHHYLGEITGKFTSDELLGVIFSSFCIGK